MTFKLHRYEERPATIQEHRALRDEITRLRAYHQEIADMPFSMVNDSDSLRHSIKTMQHLARTALSSDNGTKP